MESFASGASEEQLKILIEQCPVAIAMFDKDMIYLAASNKWISDLVHDGAAPIIGRSHYEVFPDLPEPWKKVLQRCLTGAIERSEDDAFPREDGTIDLLRWEVRPWRDRAGLIGGVIIFSEDITERKRTSAGEERRLGTILETLPVGVFLLDADGRILEVNERANRIWGGPAPHATNITQYGAYRGWWAKTGKALAAEDWAAARAITNGETSLAEVIEIQRFDDARSTILNSAAPIRDADNKIIGAVVVVQDVTAQLMDVTARQRAEEELHKAQVELENRVQERTSELSQANVFLDSLIENIPDMIFVKDAVELRFLRFNKAGEDLVGYSRSEMIGKNDYDFFPKAEADFFTAKDRVVIGSGAVLDIAEESIQTRNLGNRILHTKKLSIPGPKGEPKYLLGISEDITEKKQAEEVQMQLIREQAARTTAEHLKKRAEFLSSASQILAGSLDYKTTFDQVVKLVVPTLADWCIAFDKDLKAIAIGASKAEKVAGLREALARFPFMSNDASSAAEALRTGRPVLRAKFTEENLLAAAKGPEHLKLMSRVGIVSLLAVPLIVRGGRFGVLVLISSTPTREFGQEDVQVAEEIARRASVAVENAHLYSEAQRAIQVREDFISIASHELRTPLTSLMLQTQLISRLDDQNELTSLPKEELTRLLKSSQRQVARLSGLVNELMEASRIRAGHLPLKIQKTDLSELVQQTVERLSPELKAAECVTRLQVEGPVTGDWDPLRLEQVVVNLLTNAMKYGAGKAIEISVNATGDEASFVVRDHGIGIAKEDQARIFERFERASSTKEYGGLGLGLFITREIVDAHGGEIRVESEAGKGAVFTVVLPLRR